MAREVMVPRTDAFMVDINDSFQENLDKILKEPYSRVPVYDGDKDKIVGVIHIRTVLRKAHKVGFDKLDYDQVMFKPLFAPETIELGELLVEMQETQRQHTLLDQFLKIIPQPYQLHRQYRRQFLQLNLQLLRVQQRRRTHQSK